MTAQVKVGGNASHGDERLNVPMSERMNGQANSSQPCLMVQWTDRRLWSRGYDWRYQVTDTPNGGSLSLYSVRHSTAQRDSALPSVESQSMRQACCYWLQQ